MQLHYKMDIPASNAKVLNHFYYHASWSSLSFIAILNTIQQGRSHNL